jgi:hypothetical protein
MSKNCCELAPTDGVTLFGTLHIVSNCQTSKEAWNRLSNIFENSGLQRKIHFKTELNNLTYMSCKNMQKFLNKVITVQQQLSAMGANVPDEELRVMILMKLPERYQPLVMALESTAPDNLTLDMVTSRLLKEKARKQAMECEHSEENSLNMKLRGERKFRVQNKYEIENTIRVRGNIQVLQLW